MADRSSLINQIYYQELGRLEADQEGLNYWLSRDDLSDEDLRANIRAGAGMEGGASVVAPLLADSQYSRFLRGMQFSESQIQSNLSAAQEAASRRIRGERSTFDQQREQGAENINSSFEARQNRSGARLSKLSDQRTAVDMQQNKFETGVNEGTAALQRQSAQEIAALRRENAEQQTVARERLTARSAGV